MSNTVVMQNEIMRDAFYAEQSGYYSDKINNGYYDEKSKSGVPQQNEGGDIFAEEEASRHCEGPNESSGDDSYSADDADKDKGQDYSGSDDDGQFTTLQTVSGTYLTQNSYRSPPAPSSQNSYRSPPAPSYTHSDYGYSADQSPQQLTRAGDYQNIPVALYQNKTEPSPTLNYGSPPQGGTQNYNDNSSQRNPFPYHFPVEIKQEIPYYPTSTNGIAARRGTGAPTPENWGYGANMEGQHASKACVFLCNRELWSKFHAHETEMIVTKQGR